MATSRATGITVLSPLEITQKRRLKISLFKNKSFSVKDLFQQAKIFDIKNYFETVTRHVCNNKIVKNINITL